MQIIQPVPLITLGQIPASQPSSHVLSDCPSLWRISCIGSSRITITFIIIIIFVIIVIGGLTTAPILLTLHCAVIRLCLILSRRTRRLTSARRECPPIASALPHILISSLLIALSRRSVGRSLANIPLALLIDRKSVV